LEKFYKYGLSMFTIVNREYCKKILVSLPKQIHPAQYHKKKEETFNVIYGNVDLVLDGKKNIYIQEMLLQLNQDKFINFPQKKGL
jgi:D-lyxose ketol-isomerase